ELLRFDNMDWPEKTRLMQTNWIGRSEGAEIRFRARIPATHSRERRARGGEKSRKGKAASAAESEHASPMADTASTSSLLAASSAVQAFEEVAIPVFTTRPDTIYGVTFFVLAPEHPLVERMTAPEQRAVVQAYIEEVRRETEIERLSTDVARRKTGVPLGTTVTNPVSGQEAPVWIADYVLMGYGTGAVMGVPAHDQRDFEFARAFGLPIVEVIRMEGELATDPATWDAARPHYGAMVNSDSFDGSPPEEAIGKVIAWLEEHDAGKGAVSYRLRDWLISRQRYWGAPIPIVYCPEHGAVPVPEEQLPVMLPDEVQFKPTGESPLRYVPEFLN